MQASHFAADRGATTGAFVSWIAYHGRSQGFIERFGLTPIYASFRGRGLGSAPFKYVPQFITTLRGLYRTRPDVVFVMDPPVFAVGAVFLYCLSAHARYVMDCHSGVFNSRKWRWSLALQRFFGRRAAAVLVTNPIHLEVVSRWPARGLIVGDPPPTGLPASRVLAKSAQPYVFVIGVFGEDEDIPVVLEAAGRLPEIAFRISGDTGRARPEWIANPPSNVTFTGFLPNDEFWSHIRDAAAVMTLTTREDTILQGGWEAMFMERPLITSRTRALQKYFTRGTVFVDHTPDSIAGGVKDAMTHTEALEREARLLREEKYAAWCEERASLVRLAGLPFRAQEPPG